MGAAKTLLILAAVAGAVWYLFFRKTAGAAAGAGAGASAGGDTVAPPFWVDTTNAPPPAATPAPPAVAATFDASWNKLPTSTSIGGPTFVKPLGSPRGMTFLRAVVPTSTAVVPSTFTPAAPTPYVRGPQPTSAAPAATPSIGMGGAKPKMGWF
jgi:hypothetical protein